MIYTHVLNRGACCVGSPLDRGNPAVLQCLLIALSSIPQARSRRQQLGTPLETSFSSASLLDVWHLSMRFGEGKMVLQIPMLRRTSSTSGRRPVTMVTSWGGSSCTT